MFVINTTVYTSRHYGIWDFPKLRNCICFTFCNMGHAYAVKGKSKSRKIFLFEFFGSCCFCDQLITNSWSKPLITNWWSESFSEKNFNEIYVIKYFCDQFRSHKHWLIFFWSQKFWFDHINFVKFILITKSHESAI